MMKNFADQNIERNLQLEPEHYSDLEALLISVQHKLAGIDEMVSESFRTFQSRLQNSREWLKSIYENLQKFENNLFQLINNPFIINFHKLIRHWEEQPAISDENYTSNNESSIRHKAQFANLNVALEEISEQVGNISDLLEMLKADNRQNGDQSNIISNCIKAGLTIIQAERALHKISSMTTEAGYDIHEVMLHMMNGCDAKGCSEMINQLKMYLEQLDNHLHKHVPRIKNYAHDTLKQIDNVVTSLQYEDIILQKLHFINNITSDVIREFNLFENPQYEKSSLCRMESAYLHILPEISDIFVRQLVLSKIEFHKAIVDTQQRFNPIFGYRKNAERINQLMLRKLDQLLENLFSLLQSLGEVEFYPEVNQPDQKNDYKDMLCVTFRPNSLSAVEGCLMSLQDYTDQLTSENNELPQPVQEQIFNACNLMRQLIFDLTSEFKNDDITSVNASNKNMAIKVSARVREIWHLVCNLEQMLKNAGEHLNDNTECINSLFKLEQESIILIRNQTKIESEVEIAISILEKIASLSFETSVEDKLLALNYLKTKYNMQSQRQIHASVILERFGNLSILKDVPDNQDNIEIF
jgi:hypothetical protein